MIDSEIQDDVGKVANENRILNELVAAKVMTDNATSSFTSLHPDELIAGTHIGYPHIFYLWNTKGSF